MPSLPHRPPREPAEEMAALLFLHLRSALGVSPRRFSVRFHVTDGLRFDWAVVDGPVAKLPMQTNYLLGDLDPEARARLKARGHLPEPPRDEFFSPVFRLSTEDEFCPPGVDQPDGCDFTATVLRVRDELRITLVTKGTVRKSATQVGEARLVRHFSTPVPN